MKRIFFIGCSVANFCLLISFTSCSVNKANVDNSLKEFFDQNKVDGCFTMFNNTDGKVTVYNMSLDTARFLPASTFKIVNSLIGLEIGKITDEKMLIKWVAIVLRQVFPTVRAAILSY